MTLPNTPAVIEAKHRRTRTAMRHDPNGPTLVEQLRITRDRHETALWLVPTLFLIAAMAAAFWR